jgi:hypothetical protein
MADLSARLPTEIDSQKRFVGAAPATPSIWESIANFGSGVVGVASRAWSSLDEGAAKKHQQEDVAAKNATARSVLDQQTVVNGQNPSYTPDQAAAASEAKSAGKTMLNQQTAASQGAIDPGSAQARMLATARQLFAKFPGHEAVIYNQLKEMGVSDMITQQYRNAESALEDNATAQRSSIHKLEDDAVNKWGYTDYYQRSPDEQATIRASVGLANLKENQLDEQTKQADLLLKQADLSDKQRTSLQTQTSSNLVTSVSDYMTSSFANVNKMMINMLTDPTLTNDPARMEKVQSHLMSVAIPTLDQAFALKVAPLAGTMKPEDFSRVTDLFKMQKQSLIDMISGPQSIVQQNQRIMQNLTDTYGIDYAKSAPTLMRLQKLIGPQALGVLLSPNITGNKPLMDMVANELKGVISDPSKTPSFSEFVQTLNGEADMSSFDPAKIRAMAPAQIASTATLSKDAVASNGTDKQAHLALVNSIKNTSGIASDVVPAWGFKNVLTQSKVLNSKGVTRAIFETSANAQERKDASRSWIPANTRSYAALARLDAGDQYYKAALDPHTLTWQAVWNGKKVISQSPVESGAFSLAEAASPGTYARPTVKPAPSTAVLEQVSTLNHQLHNLSDAASKGWDDTFNGKSIPFNEAKRFFATGEIPSSLQKPTKGKDGKTPEQNVDDAISHMLDFVNKLPTTVTPTSGPLTDTIKAAADKYAVPSDIAARLFHLETSDGRNKARSDKGATGPAQIMPNTAKAYGKDVNTMSDAENIDLGMRILSDNYKKTGNWHDAVAMYHSGVDLATAAKQGRTDGHMKTVDYVASIVGGPSSISAENLARYGYVRR